MRYIDLTHTVTADMPVFPGDSKPSLKEVASFEQHGYVNYELTSLMHVGTHADGPAHMIPRGKRLVDFSVETYFGRAVVLDARGVKIIGADLLQSADLSGADSVLIYTGWDEQYGKKEYYFNYPVIDEGFAGALVARQIKIIGMDGPSPDQPPFPVHKLLLQNDIIILENLTNLAELVGIKHFEIITLPLKIEADSAPVRVVARLD